MTLKATIAIEPPMFPYVGGKRRTRQDFLELTNPLLVDTNGRPRRDLEFLFPFSLLAPMGVIMPRPPSTSPEKRKTER